MRLHAARPQQQHQRLAHGHLLRLVRRGGDDRAALRDAAAGAKQLEDLGDRRLVVLQRDEAPRKRSALDALSVHASVERSRELPRHPHTHRRRVVA